ncbi:unnamed protein product, partial [Prunus brigantina]
EQSSPEPLSPRTAAVRAGFRRNYSSSSTESKSYKSEGSSKIAEIPKNNDNVKGGGALAIQPLKPLREFSIPKVTDQPSCIVYPQLTIDRFELRTYEAFTFFESLSANSQQWSYNIGREAPKKAVVSKISTNNEIDAKLDVMSLNSLIIKYYLGFGLLHPLGNKVEVQDKSFAEHMLEQANALQARNLHNDPYSNTYNSGWRNHPNFRWNKNLKDLP